MAQRVMPDLMGMKNIWCSTMKRTIATARSREREIRSTSPSFLIYRKTRSISKIFIFDPVFLRCPHTSTVGKGA